jgi:hypothetical protein
MAQLLVVSENNNFHGYVIYFIQFATVIFVAPVHMFDSEPVVSFTSVLEIISILPN